MKTIQWYLYLPLLGLLLLFGSGCETETLQLEVREEQVDVGGYSLYTRTIGTEGPKIVLLSGLAGTTNDWTKLEKELVDLGQTISYDREGLGRSAWQKRPKDSYTVATELRNLLAAKHLTPPYILVAHSLSGIYARAFADHYPELVAGLVLVDPTPEDLVDSLIATLPAGERAAAWAQYHQEQQAVIATLPEGGIKEEVKFLETLYEQARAMSFTTSAPVAVLSSMKSEVADDQLSKEIARQLRDRLLDEIAAGPRQHYLTTRSGHFIQQEEPALVVAAIEWVLANE